MLRLCRNYLRSATKRNVVAVKAPIAEPSAKRPSTSVAPTRKCDPYGAQIAALSYRKAALEKKIKFDKRQRAHNAKELKRLVEVASNPIVFLSSYLPADTSSPFSTRHIPLTPVDVYISNRRRQTTKFTSAIALSACFKRMPVAEQLPFAEAASKNVAIVAAAGRLLEEGSPRLSADAEALARSVIWSL